MTANEWNDQYTASEPVVVTLDDGTLWKTKTRSVAWELGDGTPVVLLEGKRGGYALKRVTALPR